MRTFLLLAVVAAAGCAGAPVQEMSDARQVIQAARQAGAQRHSPEDLAEAERLLHQAEKRLEIGAYREARRLARAAKEKAAKARRAALAAGGSE